MKVYVIILDNQANIHQASLDESQEIIISNLVSCYPNNNMTKDFINDVVIELAKKVNFKKVK